MEGIVKIKDRHAKDLESDDDDVSMNRGAGRCK